MAAMAAHPASVIHGQPPVPYLGSKLSLISKSDMRYEGILYTVDTDKATIALAKVRSFGTEQRREKEVSGQNEVYEFIIFKASDIKDITVLETPKAFPSLLMTGPPQDPTILQTIAPISQNEADHLKLQKKRLVKEEEILDLKKTIALQNEKIRAMSSAGLNGAASSSGIGQFKDPFAFPNINEMMRMMTAPGPDLARDVAVSIATPHPMISASAAITTSATSIGGAATGLPPSDVLLSLALPSQQIGTCDNEMPTADLVIDGEADADGLFDDEDEDLTKLFDMADVTFVVQERRIYHVRSVLAYHSARFKEMLLGPKTDHNKEVQIKDCIFVDFLALLKLLKAPQNNSGKEIIRNANVEKLLELAALYQLPLVTMLCQNFILTNWKFSEARIVEAVKLAAKFGLHVALRDLLTQPCAEYPSLIKDTNIEQLLEIAKQYQLESVKDKCEKYLLENWKQDARKIVRAVELSAKFGLEKALANLVNARTMRASVMTDGNVEQLLELCLKYSLFNIRVDCELYILNSWINRPEKALRAVELAHKADLPKLAKTFIPLAAKRPLREIDASMKMLSAELYAAILHCFGLLHSRDDIDMRTDDRRYGDLRDCAYCEECGYNRCRCNDPVIDEMIGRPGAFFSIPSDVIPGERSVLDNSAVLDLASGCAADAPRVPPALTRNFPANECTPPTHGLAVVAVGRDVAHVPAAAGTPRKNLASRPDVKQYMDPRNPRRGIYARMIRSFGKPDVSARDDSGTFSRNIIGCTFNEEEQRYVICDTGHNVVKTFRANGDPFITLTSGVQGHFRHPSAVLYAPDMKAYIIKDENSVGVFNYEGRPIREFGRGMFRQAYGLARDRHGLVYTIDASDWSAKKKLKLYRFDPRQRGSDHSCSFELESFTFEGTGGCGFMDVGANDRIVATDYGNDVSITDLQGKLIRRFGSLSNDDGQSSCPSGIAVDANGIILLGDSRNNRIQIFDADGYYLSQIKFNTAICCPMTIHLTAFGQLMVMNVTSNPSINVYQLEHIDTQEGNEIPV